ncbi:hypothetical protein [Microcoleus sp. BROC3]|uniref:hypothetical protein n=1 Tax=Microcoleus sp. BROC3 TaxID=3055323 RepID=UPI002FD596B8
MDKYSYRFTVASLGVSVMMISAGCLALAIQDKDPMLLVPVLGAIIPGLIGLLVPSPKSSPPSSNDYPRS